MFLLVMVVSLLMMLVWCELMKLVEMMLGFFM